MTWQDTIPGEIYFVKSESEKELGGVFVKYAINDKSEALIDVDLAGPGERQRVENVPRHNDVFEDIIIRRITKMERAKAKLYGL